MPQPFLLLIAAHLILAVCLGWKWSLWPVPTWLEVQRNKYIFFLTLYVSIIDMIYLRTVFMTPQRCHSHFCCWLLPICPELDVWAENGAYGLCRLERRYNGANLYFSWPNMSVLMIWNNFEISAWHLSHATAIFVIDCCQFGPCWVFRLKMELMACADLVGGTTEQSCRFSILTCYYKWYKKIPNCLNHASSVPQPFLLLIAANLALAGFLGWKWSLWPMSTWLTV